MSLAFFSMLEETWQKRPPAAPFRHGRYPGDVLWVVMGRFAGQEYSFAVSREYIALFCAL